jgi:FkbM family methyltransferase
MRKLPRHPIKSVKWRLNRFDEPSIPKRSLRPFVPKNAVIVEAGAHHGHDTVQFARLWPKSEIHAFEPVREAYEWLVRNTARYPNVRTYPLALGGSEGVLPMWISDPEHDYSSSLLEPARHLDEFPQVSFTATRPTEVTTLEAWAEREGVGRIDAMWLDLQGAELDALKGAGRILETTKAMILEVSTVELYKGAPLWPEVKAWLAEHGFELAQESWWSETSGDALVVRAKPSRA